MKHIAEDVFNAYVFDSHTLSAAELVHLAHCAECQAQLAVVRHMRDELKLAQRSKPSVQALARYGQLFSHVQQQPGLWTRMAQRLRAQLSWDSRQQPALQGMRAASATHYRQLYTTGQVEIELMVASRQLHQFDVEGDLLTPPGQGSIAPALVQLQRGSEQQPIYEVESDANGRFHLGNIAPGHYQLLITPSQGALIEIADLEIT